MQVLLAELRASALPEDGLEHEKEYVESYLLRVCEVLKTENRGPDDWETSHLLAAVGSIAGHL